MMKGSCTVNFVKFVAFVISVQWKTLLMLAVLVN